MSNKKRSGPLKPRERKFVEEYLKHGHSKQAALAAGFPERRASTWGSELVRHHTEVKAALAEARSKSVTAAAYNIQAAMSEADSAIQFARETENANAYVKAVELKSKLNGLLIEKHQHQVANFQLNVEGIHDIPAEVVVATSVVGDEDEDDEIFR